jgi:hypothetical protein
MTSYRSYKRRKAAYAALLVGCVRIQSYFRRHLAKKKLLDLIKALRPEEIAKKERRKFIAVLKIQMFVRRKCLRNYVMPVESGSIAKLSPLRKSMCRTFIINIKFKIAARKATKIES